MACSFAAERIAVDNTAHTARNSRLARSCLVDKLDRPTGHQQDNRHMAEVDDSLCFAADCWRSRPLDDAMEERWNRQL